MASPQQSFLSKLMGGNQLNLTPSPERSQLVQLLQQQSAQPQQSFSTLGSLNIASKPILAALLARQEQGARQAERARTGELVSSLLNRPPVADTSIGLLGRDAEGNPVDAGVQPGTVERLDTRGRKTADVIGELVGSQDPVAQEIGINALTTQNGGTTGERRVHSVQILDGGNIGYIDAFTGEVVDTGTKASESHVFRETPGGGLVAVDRSNPSATTVVRTPEEGTDEAAIRAGSENTASAQARQDVERAEETRASVPGLTEQINIHNAWLQKFEAGEMQTGRLSATLPFNAAAIGRMSVEDLENFRMFAGENILGRIGEATFGSLSEGEREFIGTTVVGEGVSEAGNITALKGRIQKFRDARARENQDALRLGVREMSDLLPEEIEDLIAFQEAVGTFQ